MNKFILLFCIQIFTFSVGVAAESPNESAPQEQNSSLSRRDNSKPAVGRAFSFYIENDTNKIGGPGSDDAYSNGFKFAYTYAEDKIPIWVKPLTSWSDDLQQNFAKSRTNFGFSFAQQIYTPSNTADPDLIPDDRPYAAWLYVGLTANFRTSTRSHSLELDLGMVGPSALGKQVQNNFHRIIDQPATQGWKNQLNDEPTAELSYQERLRLLDLREHDQSYFDFIPYFGLALGNVLDSAHVGAMARIGLNLPDDFGPSRPSELGGDAYISPKLDDPHDKKFSLYAFGGIRGNAVARNIFLDGNTFRDSHHVTKYPFVLETEFGVGTQIYRWGLVWRFVTRSPEFKEKEQVNSFASVSITYSFASPGAP